MEAGEYILSLPPQEFADLYHLTHIDPPVGKHLLCSRHLVKGTFLWNLCQNYPGGPDIFQPGYLKLNQLGFNDPMFQNIKKRLGKILLNLRLDKVEVESK